LDDASLRLDKRPAYALSMWEDAAFTSLPSGSLLLISSPALYERLLATAVAGSLPPDLELLPTYDPSLPVAARALTRDPRLVPLFRDLALQGSPQELSLATLAGNRALVVAPDPHSDRSLLRHLIPYGLLSVFEPEPRGGTDRRRALDASSPARTRLDETLGKPKRGPLAKLTETLLEARYEVASKMGEKEVAERALLDVEAFTVRGPGVKMPNVSRTTTMP
jgi:hypothetical protein